MGNHNDDLIKEFSDLYDSLNKDESKKMESAVENFFTEENSLNLSGINKDTLEVLNSFSKDEKFDFNTKTKQSTTVKKAEKTSAFKINVHEGHRQRVANSVDTDPDFTTFSDHEILEYLLFTTIPRVDTNVLSHNLIKTFGSYSGVLNATVNELKKFSPISEPTARMLTSIIPAARRAEISRLRHNVIIDTTNKAVAYLTPYFTNRTKELLYIACIDNNDSLICVNLIAEGDINFTSFDVKKIVESICRHSAAKIIVAHNHPAQTLEASTADYEVTKRLGLALSSMGVLLIDHIIFTATNYYSFYQSGKIDEVYAACDVMIGTQIMKEVRARKSANANDKYIRNIGNCVKEDPGDSYAYYKDSKVELESFDGFGSHIIIKTTLKKPKQKKENN